MKRVLAKILGPLVCILGLGLLSLCITSCEEEVPGTSMDGEGRLILIYAVAANNLENNLYRDMQEILDVAPQLDLKNNTLLVYSVVQSGKCQLQRLEYDKTKRQYFFNTIKEYEETPLSVEETRFKEVFDYVNDNYDFPNKGLILWSHATGWLPWFAGSSGKLAKRQSFGQDIYQGYWYQCNITTLADAIPAGMFDFIWFDCCYMANIETVYQLREKTEKIVGYVTEIHSNGMPYNLTMPYLLRKNPDLKKAAFELFADYEKDQYAVTVSIMDTSELENLADATRLVMKEGEAPGSMKGIHNYSRLYSYTYRNEKYFYECPEFYDMGQLVEAYTGVSEETIENFRYAMDRAVEYKLASRYDWANKPIDPDGYSGLSMHHYVDNGTGSELYYATLDWYKDTRER